MNVSSMNAYRPLARIAAYSASKAGASNFTQWLAVHMPQEYSSEIRVNAIAPGYFVTEQNRFLMTDKKTDNLTARGQKIMDHTPMSRFGTPSDLKGAVLWLLSPASSFVTGIVMPIDGGFSAYKRRIIDNATASLNKDKDYAWSLAADFSAQRNIRWCDKPFQRVLSGAPPIYIVITNVE